MESEKTMRREHQNLIQKEEKLKELQQKIKDKKKQSNQKEEEVLVSVLNCLFPD